MRIEEAFAKVETPAYVVSEDLIRKNLQILHDVEEQSGAHILLAQKAFSMYSLYPLIGEYISGATASGINEARLGYEYMGKENHIFAPAYKENEFDEIVKICDHIIFNSYNQFAKYKDSVKKAGISCGIRVNPQFSTQEGHEIYDPCQSGSRMGITLSEFEKHDFTGIEGIHFHTLCEQNSDALVATLKVVEEQFGQYFSQLKWINFGGGHHITKPDYDRKALIDAIKYIREKYNLIVYLEPGEAIAVDTGYMVTEVMDIVHNHIDIAILDASAACHMPDVLEMPYRPNAIDMDMADVKKYTYRFGGNTCLSGDIIGDYSTDKQLKAGDRVIFEDMSIYSMVKNNTFNGINLPSIYLFSEEKGLRLIKRFGYEDFKMRLS